MAALCLAGIGFTGLAQELTRFGTVTLTPAFELNGAGQNVDSVAFWEAPDPNETLLLVTGKANNVLEIWKYPFQDNELPPHGFPSPINGVAVDQETDLVYVSGRTVNVLSLPDLQPQREFGEGVIGVGENNLDLLKHNDGRTIIYVSEDHRIHAFNAADDHRLTTFSPSVSSIETVLADDFYQMILVPEEQGILGNAGVYAYHPDGTPFLRNGTNRFGHEGEFDSDEEGILLYTLPASAVRDDGTGFIVVSDQRSDQTDLEFFDRVTWSHLGTLRLEGVSNTDGIASTQQALPDYPMGLLAAINNDGTTVGVGWHTVFAAVGWNVLPDDRRTPYQAWADRQGLTPGVNDDIAADPDADHHPNLEEFATNSDPLNPLDNVSSRAVLHAVDGARYLTSTFPVRNRAWFAGTPILSARVDDHVVAISTSHDLLEFAAEVVEWTPALADGLPPLDPGWSYHTFRSTSSVDASPSGFLLRSITPVSE